MLWLKICIIYETFFQLHCILSLTVSLNGSKNGSSGVVEKRLSGFNENVIWRFWAPTRFLHLAPLEVPCRFYRPLHRFFSVHLRGRYEGPVLGHSPASWVTCVRFPVGALPFRHGDTATQHILKPMKHSKYIKCRMKSWKSPFHFLSVHLGLFRAFLSHLPRRPRFPHLLLRGGCLLGSLIHRGSAWRQRAS